MEVNSEKKLTVTQGRLLLHGLVAGIGINDKSRGVLIEESVTQQQRVRKLVELCNWETAPMQDTNQDEEKVRNMLNKMEINDRAETLAKYIQSSGNSHIWRKYIDHFSDNLLECNFVEIGYLVFMANVLPLVYCKDELRTDYHYVCEKNGFYEWDISDKTTHDTGNLEDKNLSSNSCSYAMVIDVRKFKEEKFNRQDRDNLTNELVKCLRKAGFELHQYPNEEASKTDWNRKKILDTVDEFINFCATCQPKRILLILMSCGVNRDSILTSDLEEIVFGEIESRLSNVSDVGTQIKNSKKNAIFFQDITMRLPESSSSSDRENSEEEHAEHEHVHAQNQLADSANSPGPNSNEKQNFFATIPGLPALTSVTHALVSALLRLLCLIFPAFRQRNGGSKKVPVPPDVQYVSENRKQSEKLQFCSSLFLHCVVFLFRQLHSTHSVDKIFEVAEGIVQGLTSFDENYFLHLYTQD